jgi:hypothetical protein
LPIASVAAACAARVCACVVWLPPETQDQGRFLLVLPHVSSHFSHGMPTISAATRCVSLIDSVPRLPMPDWMYIRPSGLITKRPSKPTEPATNVLTATPTPRTFVPWRFPIPVVAFRSSHLKSSPPRSSASLMKALVACARAPCGDAGPNMALPSGALILLIAT